MRASLLALVKSIYYMFNKDTTVVVENQKTRITLVE